ncbi:MAG: hypothetical protein RBS57_10040 [Desulforhabdus sp.]|nr:hypothetical protein [Desulforhabdus sp.]
MSVDRILDAIEQYLKVKEELQISSVEPCHDWDCGLASELSGCYGSSQQNERLNWARGALEKALNEYVDNRLRERMKAEAEG